MRLMSFPVETRYNFVMLNVNSRCSSDRISLFPDVSAAAISSHYSSVAKNTHSVAMVSL
jgi:hypothetical protein